MTDLSERSPATGRVLSGRPPRATKRAAAREVLLKDVLAAHPPSWDGLLEALPEGTALHDGRGTIHYVNGLLCAMTGYEREDLVGQNVQMLVPPRLRKAEKQARRNHANSPASVVWSSPELSMLCKDGREIPVEVSRSQLALDSGSWVVAAIRDVSAQHETEKARADAELRFRVAFENNMAPMTFTDADDKIISINDAFCQMVGFTKEE